VNTSTIRITSTARRLARTVVAIASLGSVAVACGDDAESLSSDACDRYAALQGAFFGDPAQLGPAAAAFAAAAPDGLADDAETVVEAFSSDDPEAMSDPELVAANERIGDVVFEECSSVAAIDVDGVDYAFDGLPDSVEAGRLAVRLHNRSDSDQPHELIVLTAADGRSADELVGLPMDELMQQARPVGLAFADEAGTSSTTLIDLEPGSYLLICTLPVAEGGEEAAGDGPHSSHADRGMVATLTVG
jgi:hypothetical protein